jgi:hypothetical protein
MHEHFASATWKRLEFARLAVLTATALLGAAGHTPTAYASDLASALLVQSDLPSGWSIGGPLDADAGVMPSCPSVATPVQPAGRAGIWLMGQEANDMAYDVVAEYNSGQAALVMARAAVESLPCTWEESADGIVTVTYELWPAQVVGLGDEAVSRRLEVSTDSIQIQADFTLIRRGDHLATVSHVIPMDADAAGDTVEQTLAATVDRKLVSLGE